MRNSPPPPAFPTQAAAVPACLSSDLLPNHLCIPIHPHNHLQRAGLATFAHKHTVQPDDSVQRLAVRYGVDAAHVRRLNGLMTDFSLLSRTHVYLPVLSAAELAGRRVAFETDRTCRRELAVLLPRDDCCCQEQQEEEEQEEGGGKGERETEEARAWRRQGHGGKVGGPTAEQVTHLGRGLSVQRQRSESCASVGESAEADREHSSCCCCSLVLACLLAWQWPASRRL